MVDQVTTEADPFEANLKHIGEDFSTEAATTTETPDETATQSTEPKADKTEQTATSTEQTPVVKDSTSGKPDGAGKSGKEAQGEVALRPGDLKLQDGTVIKAGVERRHYETAQLAKQQLAAANTAHEQTKTQLQQLQTRVSAYETAQQATGALPPEQAVAASRLYSDLARDPVGTVTKLLAELKSKGHTIDGIGSAVDTAAIQLMIKQQNQPTQVVNQQVDVEAEAARETGLFFSQYPDAVMHDEVLADIITRHPNLSLQDAYFQLRQSVIQRGLDWSKPILPQLEPQQQQVETQQQQQQKPLVSGRGGADFVEDKVAFTPAAGETFDDIIRAAMQEAR